MRIKSLAVAVALLASTTGCVAGADEDVGTSSTSEALGWSGAPASLHYDEDAPMPLDHPEPLPPIDFRMPSAHPFDIFREPDEWERNPMSLGCFMRFVVIQDPRGQKLEVAITDCY